MFMFPITETLMDSRLATTELAWTTYPESGVSTRVTKRKRTGTVQAKGL